MLGLFSNIPACVAKPICLGCKYPLPSNINKSMLFLSCFTASNTSGISLNAKHPGI